jgi:glycosyltransferase involved in cell wall biosynthesis
MTFFPIAATRRPRVVLITHTVFHYRKQFHELARARLSEAGIDYEVLHGQPDRTEGKKGDTADLSFGRRIANRYVYLSKSRNPLILQPAFREARGADLTIIIQENRLLINYLLQLLPRGGRRLALFGHGRNYQSRKPDGVAEGWKRFWAKRCDWWFGYTDETKRHLVSLGFPEDRVTVFNNAVDTGELQRLAGQVDQAEEARLRTELEIAGNNIAIFVGGLYPDKRIDFLVAAAERVRARLPDFTLVVVGGGQDAAKLNALAAGRPWLIAAGPRFGSEKVALLRLAKLFLMPGLLGLAVLDAGVMALPVITTRFPWHSPEIAYLRDGETGVIVPDWESEAAYADVVLALLTDEPRRRAMALAARDHVACFTIEAMAKNFADGVMAALAAPPRRRS